MSKTIFSIICFFLSLAATSSAQNPDSVIIPGDLRIIGEGSGLVFPDGSMQYSATLQGPKGDKGDPGQQGPAGQISLASICDAIIAADKVPPSFCSPITLNSIAISPRDIFSPAPGTVNFTALGKFSDSSTQNLSALVSWSSSNPTIAMVDSTGKVTSISPGTTMITATSGRFSDSTRLTLFALQEFSIPTTSSDSLGITSGTDGNLWFTEYHGSKIGRITSAGVITEFPIPSSGNGPVRITSGPDGNLWFGGGHITTSGVLTYTGANYINDITSGPDGNLWVTYSNSVVRSSASDGTSTNFAIPTTGSNPIGITAGPDGNLWFTELYGNKIGKITPTGTITEFTVPTANSYPQYIATGPDGNLWFTEYTGNKIGRITTAGVITEFPLPMVGSSPSSIVAGPDGNIWFTEYSGSKIGMITPAGVITEFNVPSSGPRGITAGPDGNIWFVENDSNKIGKIIINQ